MSSEDQPTAVGSLPETGTTSTSTRPAVLTRLVWLLWVASLGVVVARVFVGGPWEVPGLVHVDGLTVVMWTVVTFISGIVHSYSRRYMAGSRHGSRFITRLFQFTVIVLTLVAAEHIALFWLAWLAMGLVMADLIGTVKGWPQAQAAARYARRSFLLSSVCLGVALGILWWATGDTTVSGLASVGDAVGATITRLALGALVLAATMQSALVPFHGWLLASMTAPTPASALMHAGFVNAGGILLARFAPLVTVDPAVMTLVVIVGAASALLAKLIKSVQSSVKRELGCSTVGQMGFMLMQAGLGFFGAAITHLVLHGFYKAYHFLSAGGRVEHTSPDSAVSDAETWSVPGVVVTLLTGVAGGALFAVLTGKGTRFDSGIVLTLLVVVLLLDATWDVVRRQSLPLTARYVAVPVVGLAAIAVYAAVYAGIKRLVAGGTIVSAPTDVTVVHGLVAVAFVVASVAVETGLYTQSQRLYVALVNASQPPADTLMTTSEEYNEY